MAKSKPQRSGGGLGRRGRRQRNACDQPRLEAGGDDPGRQVRPIGRVEERVVEPRPLALVELGRLPWMKDGPALRPTDVVREYFASTKASSAELNW